MKMGKDSVVAGNLPADTNVGDRSVVIGATDDRGNTVFNTPMAIGHGAKAGPGSVAIGAHANSAQEMATMNAEELGAELRALRAITLAQTVAIVKLLSLNPQGRQDIAARIGPTLDLTLAMTLADAERAEIERQLRMFAGLPQKS